MSFAVFALAGCSNPDVVLHIKGAPENTLLNERYLEIKDTHMCLVIHPARKVWLSEWYRERSWGPAKAHPVEVEFVYTVKCHKQYEE